MRPPSNSVFEVGAKMRGFATQAIDLATGRLRALGSGTIFAVPESNPPHTQLLALGDGGFYARELAATLPRLKGGP